MTRRRCYAPQAGAPVVDDPRQGWLFPKEELLSNRVIVNKYGDFVQVFAPLVVADPPTEGEAA